MPFPPRAPGNPRPYGPIHGERHVGECLCKRSSYATRSSIVENGRWRWDLGAGKRSCPGYRTNVLVGQEPCALLPSFSVELFVFASSECYGLNGGNPISPLKQFPGSHFRFLFSLSPAALAPPIDPCGRKESRGNPVKSMSLNGLENRVVLLRVARIKEEAHPVA